MAARRGSALLLGSLLLLLPPGCLAKRGATGSGDGGEAGALGEGGEGGTAAASSGGLDAATCEACMAEQVGFEDPCELLLVQCQDDPGCASWLDCYGRCTLGDWSAECLGDCDTAAPLGLSLVHSLLSCTCAECVAEPSCAPVCR